MFKAVTQLCVRVRVRVCVCVRWTLYFCPRRFGNAPMQCDLSLLVTLQALS